MSEQRSRGERDFSRYDAMTTEELNALLRLDAEAPPEQETDTELLLYIMGVLADRKQNTDSTGKTAQKSWESFQRNYLSELEDAPAPHRRRWARRLTAAAAVLVLLLPVTARAFGPGDLWDVVARWAKETFSFVSGESAHIQAPEESSQEEYSSLQDALEKSNRDASMVPTWVPEGFVLLKIIKDISPAQELYRALYLCNEKELIIRVQNYISTDLQSIEVEEDILEIYEISGISYYIFNNVDQLRAVWVIGSYECNVSGDVSLDEIKMMIDSIGKG